MSEVNRENRQVSVLLLLSVVFLREFFGKGGEGGGLLGPDTTGLTRGDFYHLAELTLEGVGLSCIEEIADQLRPTILAQYPDLGRVSIDGLTDENFEAWLAMQTKNFGEQLTIS